MRQFTALRARQLAGQGRKLRPLGPGQFCPFSAQGLARRVHEHVQRGPARSLARILHRVQHVGGNAVLAHRFDDAVHFCRGKARFLRRKGRNEFRHRVVGRSDCAFLFVFIVFPRFGKRRGIVLRVFPQTALEKIGDFQPELISRQFGIEVGCGR